MSVHSKRLIACVSHLYIAQSLCITRWTGRTSVLQESTPVAMTNAAGCHGVYPLQAQSVMWALKSSLAKEPVMTEELLGSCMATLRPVQIAQLIVAYFPRTVWPDLYAFCSAVLPRNGITHRGHA